MAHRQGADERGEDAVHHADADGFVCRLVNGPDLLESDFCSENGNASDMYRSKCKSFVVYYRVEMRIWHIM